MNLAPVIAILLLVAAPLFAQDAAAWQKRTIARYPDLAKEGSPIHTKFMAIYNELKEKQPTFFNNPAWPALIGDRAAAALQAEAVAAKQAAAAAAEKEAQEALWKDTHSIREVETDQLSFLDKPFVMTGSIEVSSYYNWGYRGAESTHYSFDLRNDRKRCHAFMERTRATELRKQLLAADGSLKGRFLVVISRQRFEKSSGELLLELLDYRPLAE